MKKIMLIAIAAATFTACNDSAKTTETTTVETDHMNDSHATAQYTPGEGDVTYRNDKVMVYRNGEWVESTTEVRLENGVVVNDKGVVIKDGKATDLEEGEVVTKTGQFFNKAGEGIENAWDATKRGVRDAADATKRGLKSAGDAIERGADKVGEKTKEVVN